MTALLTEQVMAGLTWERVLTFTGFVVLFGSLLVYFIKENKQLRIEKDRAKDRSVEIALSLGDQLVQIGKENNADYREMARVLDKVIGAFRK